MGFIIKFITRIVLNGLALYVAKIYFPGFILNGGIETLAIGGLILTALNIFIRPVLKIVSAPLVWISFGLFNIVINMVILWVADQLLTEIAFTNLVTLFWVSIIIALANSFL